MVAETSRSIETLTIEVPVRAGAGAAGRSDRRVIVSGFDWSQLERVIAHYADRPGVRLAYLDGDLELMTPSIAHGRLKKVLARLIEAYGEEAGIEVDGYGSWMLKDEQLTACLEPDECYVIGGEHVPGDRGPDLAIEVDCVSGGIDRLEIYRRLGVREVWRWRRGQIAVYELGPAGYTRRDTSAVLPQIDLGALCEFLGRDERQTALVLAWRRWLRARAEG